MIKFYTNEANKEAAEWEMGDDLPIVSPHTVTHVFVDAIELAWLYSRIRGLPVVKHVIANFPNPWAQLIAFNLAALYVTKQDARKIKIQLLSPTYSTS